MHFGGDVVANGTVDSKNISDGFGTLSLWDYGQLTKQGYYQTLEASGEASKCKTTYRNPTAGYKPHDPFDGLGKNWRGRPHLGVDVGGLQGDPLFAAADGTIETVVYNTSNKGWGTNIVIRHPDGNQTRYAHLSSVAVSAGTGVAKGDIIGAIGSTGFSTGPHLHFEVIVGGQHIDPDTVVDWNDY